MKQLEKDQKTKIFEDIGKQKTISYEDFINTEETDNLKLLIGFMNNKLIPNSTYLEENKEKLTTIFEKLSTFDKKKNIYLDTILNEQEEIQKIFIERFKLFKLIKEEDTFDPEAEFLKI